ncbi:MAG: LacI family DNA-binding transcriptional regulator, partial [Thermodesulfovibrionales bacterium]
LRRTKTLGLIFPDIENPFFISLVKKAEEVAHKNNYNIVICNTENRPDKERLYIEVLKGRLIDGYIVIPSVSDNPGLYELLKNEKVVFVDRFAGLENEICIKLDNMGGVDLAIGYLCGLGHRRIGIVNVPLNITTGLERFEGYKKSLESNGRMIDETLIGFADFSIESGYKETLKLLKLKNMPTAIIPMSGPTTIGALKAIKECELRIPDDISIIGFDDFAYAELLRPPLTTIAQPAYDFGAIATEILLKVIKGKSIRKRIIELKPELKVRGSCKAVR